MKTSGIADQLLGPVNLAVPDMVLSRQAVGVDGPGPGSMKPIELTVGKLHKKGVDAVTLWPLILYRLGHRDDIALRCHEHFHWCQALRWGVLPWYLWYLALVPFYLGKRSHEHPLERPAYELQWQVQEKLKSGASIEAELASVGLA